jgi:hypothetical protein
MEFVLLAAIFLTSSGFLVGAAVEPTPAAISGNSAIVAPQAGPQLSGSSAPLIKQDPERCELARESMSARDRCDGST